MSTQPAFSEEINAFLSSPRVALVGCRAIRTNSARVLYGDMRNWGYDAVAISPAPDRSFAGAPVYRGCKTWAAGRRGVAADIACAERADRARLRRSRREAGLVLRGERPVERERSGDCLLPGTGHRGDPRLLPVHVHPAGAVFPQNPRIRCPHDGPVPALKEAGGRSRQALRFWPAAALSVNLRFTFCLPTASEAVPAPTLGWRPNCGNRRAARASEQHDEEHLQELEPAQIELAPEKRDADGPDVRRALARIGPR